MPRYALEALVIGALDLGDVEAAAPAEAEAAAWAALQDQDLTARLPELRRVMVEHMMVEPAGPAGSEVMS